MLRIKHTIPAQSWLLILLVPLVMPGCSPKSSYGEFGAQPKAAFTVTPINGKVNSYLLTSTTADAFYFRWNIGDGGGSRAGKQIDTAYYPDKGNYTVKLILMTSGGIDSTTVAVNVANDDPNGCSGKKALLTGCTQKTWVLEQPGGGALWVGDPGGNQWWSSGEGDVTGRPCSFNDEYTFKKDGSFVLNVKGDIRVDDEGGNPWPTDIGLPVGCATLAQLPAKYQAWGGGNFNFKVIGNSKLQVIGNGAYMALYKVGEAGTTGAPEASITYDILEMTETKMVINKKYDWGQWKFTFRAK
ncbi:PKD domain-containing protein [Paraflavitalea sp. CAU 1676]|uniref:PKD domain-containing protein n=1 Tax=Paraflavitalea sp. CAU 1676 TaxID=3032598 RepID=UPI0023DA7DCC|nr:PKD domain-containing protein [Paraflavitalea sp. CAU 1676]MDF2188022.1 PKD domain-containing protein [Paraflavitalea sp. CAU 1676]